MALVNLHRDVAAGEARLSLRCSCSVKCKVIFIYLFIYPPPPPSAGVMQERDGLWRVITLENVQGELGEAALVGSQGRWQTAWGKLLLSTDENG